MSRTKLSGAACVNNSGVHWLPITAVVCGLCNHSITLKNKAYTSVKIRHCIKNGDHPLTLQEMVIFAGGGYEPYVCEMNE